MFAAAMFAAIFAAIDVPIGIGAAGMYMFWGAPIPTTPGMCIAWMLAILTRPWKPPKEAGTACVC